MKNHAAFCLISILLAACGSSSTVQEQPTETEEASSENFDWLLGKWKRIDEKPEYRTFENWEKLGANEYRGIGFIMQQTDTMSWENMTLQTTDGGWQLAVSLMDDTSATVFELIAIDGTSFTCKNDSNDFPDHIRYWFENGDLHAEIWNAEMTVPFQFVRNEE